MQRFKTFIAESVSPTIFTDLRHIISTSGKSQKAIDNYMKYVDALESGIQNNSIFNVDFTDAKYLTRLLEDAFKSAQDAEYYPRLYALGDDHYARKAFFEKYDSNSMLSLASAKKIAAFYTKLGPDFAKMAKAAQLMADLKVVFDTLKPYIIKGRKPAAPDPNKPAAFQRPPASYEASKQIIQFLDNAIAEVSEELYKQLLVGEKKDIATIKAAKITDDKSYNEFLKANGRLQILLQRCVNISGNYMKRVYSLKTDAELNAIAEQEANRSRNDIIEQFKAKNTMKLAAIVQKKEAIQTHKILKNRVRNGILENDMFFEFTDGSSFKIYSKVEYSYSVNGKLFLRFPTRFTDVKLADGKMMSQPSEEKMHKEF